MEIAQQLAGFSPAEADDLRKAIGKKNHKLMASLKEKFLDGCIANGVTPAGGEAAVGGHGEVAGLLVQQVARRLLRADRLPHCLAQGEPPVRVHGRADLVGDEHEGPRAVLRQRVRRARHRGAAAGRQLVADRLRRRRGEDPVRPHGGEERRRSGRASDRRARARTARSPRSGTSPSASTRRSSTSGRSSRSSSAARSTPTGAARLGMLAVLEQALDLGARLHQDRLLGPGVDLRRAARRGRGAPRQRAPPADPGRRVREAGAAAAGEGDARPLRLRASAAGGARAAAPRRPTPPSPSWSGGATARSSRSAASSPR